jgi:5'-nucleotidase/UDP-sugar diphosphatase
MRSTAILLGLLSATVAVAQKPLTLTVLHTNDLHAHIEPTAIKGKTYGGYARHATIIKQTRQKEKNVLLLNAGDVFQGTLYFNLYDGLADLTILNALGYQAQTIGNHEFDRGDLALVEYAKRAKFPLLGCNLDMTAYPSLRPWIKPSTVINVGGQKVGIVGVITDDLPNLTTLGTALKAGPHIESTQAAVDQLTKQGVNKIIVMSHIGYDFDQLLAKGLRDVDLIIGGHSHTPLGTPALDGWRPAMGGFPTLVKDSKGVSVPIFQAWEWGKVMGKLKLEFDAAGRLSKIAEATPIVVDQSIPEDPEIAALVDAFRKPIEAMGNTQVGTSSVALTDRTKVGYLVADSYLMATEKLGAVAALMNPGGIRANLEAGKITYGAANAICPFRNTLVVAEMTGEQVSKLLNDSKGNLIPSKGFTFALAGGGVRDIKIGGEPIDPAKLYKVTVNNFMAGGGDGLATLKDAKKTDTGLIDLDAFVEFLKANSPIPEQNEIRVSK